MTNPGRFLAALAIYCALTLPLIPELASLSWDLGHVLLLWITFFCAAFGIRGMVEFAAIYIELRKAPKL